MTTPYYKASVLSRNLKMKINEKIRDVIEFNIIFNKRKSDLVKFTLSDSVLGFTIQREKIYKCTTISNYDIRPDIFLQFSKVLKKVRKEQTKWKKSEILPVGVLDIFFMKKGNGYQCISMKYN